MGSIKIYVLLCANNKYYIGRSLNVKRRIYQHFTGRGAVWTRIHRPIKLVEVREVNSPFFEDMVVKQYMHTHGIDNVRGGSYCRKELTQSERMLLQKEIRTALDMCIRCGSKGHFISACPGKADE
jgi:hypothetical protein